MISNPHFFIAFCLFISNGIVTPNTLQASGLKDNKTPNIVFILADDFGYSSLNSYGAHKNLVRTSHIDGLAEQGIRFTNASTPASVCSPTRYGFLTGRYPWRSSLKYGVVSPLGALLPDSYSFLPSLINSANHQPRTSMVTADANGMHAIRMGNWKYIDDTPPEGLPEKKLNVLRKSFQPQLFNLAEDPGEKVNLYDENPDKVKQLSEELNRIRNAD